MFKKLRNKMLMLNMLLISAVLILSFFTIFAITANNSLRNIETRLEQSLHMVHGFMDEKGEKADKAEPDTDAARPEKRDKKSKDDKAPPPFDDNPMRTMTARLEAVTDANGAVLRVQSPFEVTDESYAARLPELLAKRKPMGFIRYADGIWAYKYVPNEDSGYVFAFMDTTAELGILRRLIVILALVGIAALAAVFFISRLFANRYIKPVEDAFNRQKQFVADASHELKTPLTTINTNAEVLLEHPDSTVAEMRKWVDYIKSETLRMTRLTEELLSLARLDHANTLVKESASVSDAAANVVLTMEALVFEKNIALDYEIAPDLTVGASAGQLKQLLTILLDNAVKYTDSGGRIELRLEKGKGNNAVLTVFNTGAGIAKEDLTRIFERFYRADKSRSRESGGYGLGLAIAKAIAEYAEGEIRAESELGEWARFTVTLPLVRS